MDTIFKDYINHDALRDFCRGNALRVSGTKGALIDVVEQAIGNGALDQNIFDEWLLEQIEFGHNRQLFFMHISDQSARQLSNIVNVRHHLASAELPVEDFNDVFSVLRPEVKTLVYLKIVSHDRMVSAIKMCFCATIELEPIEEGAPPRYENDYTWVVISIPQRSICVKVRPRGNQIQAQNEARMLFLETRELLNNVFNPSYTSTGSFKTVLYNIFKSLTTAAELPYQRTVLPHMTDIIEYCARISTALGLPSPRNPVDLPQRVSRLLERALIQQDFDAFRSSGDGKRGIIDKFFYSDRTGAQVQARAPEDEGIELADIYFDTRDTLDKLRTFDRLWVTWFKSDAEGINYIRTRLDAHTDYYVVHFFTYLAREVEEYVLREIATFERMGIE